MNKNFKKVWSIVSTVLVTVVVLCAVLLMGLRLMGFQVFAVLSGSMEPTFSTGDLIYVKKVDTSLIEVDDIITFVASEKLDVATHRVVRIDTEKQCFYTKGDVNEIEDGSPVLFKNVIGVPVFSIPLLGYVSTYIQSPTGMGVALVIGLALIVMVFLPDIILKKNKAEKKENEDTENTENTEDKN